MSEPDPVEQPHRTVGHPPAGGVEDDVDAGSRRSSPLRPTPGSAGSRRGARASLASVHALAGVEEEVDQGRRGADRPVRPAPETSTVRRPEKDW